MKILIYIGQSQNSSSSYFTLCGKIDSAFKLSECRQESECKFPISSGAGAGVTFLGTGTGARVKKMTPITSGRLDHRRPTLTSSAMSNQRPSRVFCAAQFRFSL